MEIQQARSCAQASSNLTMVPKAQTNQKLNYKQVKQLGITLNKLKQAGYQEQYQEHQQEACQSISQKAIPRVQ